MRPSLALPTLTGPLSPGEIAVGAAFRYDGSRLRSRPARSSRLDSRAVMPGRLCALALAVVGLVGASRADDPRPAAPCAGVVDDFFRDEVWAKVGAAKCLTCHKAGG